MHEIITLQFGQQANFLGTHYWNTQESYFTYSGQPSSPVDHDISFRPGLAPDNTDTYTPRTLIYDLKGAFGTLRRENALYELQHEDVAADALRLPQIPPSPYQQALDQGMPPPELTTDTVRFWSDYNHLFYHPRSIVQLNEYELNSQLMPFEKWTTGEDLFASLDREHDLLDRDLRPFLEECDQLQALQIFSSVDDAWGGFTARYLERIADELGKGCRWVFGLTNGGQGGRERQMLRMANLAQSVFSADSSASVHVPMDSASGSLPEYVRLDASSPWHTSALQTAMVESVTLPARLRSTESGRATFDHLETILNNDGNRRLATVGCTVQDPSALDGTPQTNGTHDSRMANGLTNGYHGEDHEDTDKDLRTDMSTFPPTSLTSASTTSTPSRTQTFSANVSLRGPWLPSAAITSSNASSRDPFRSSNGPRTVTSQTSLLFPLLPSYPKIFRFATASQPQNVAVKTILSTSSALAGKLRALEQSVRRTRAVGVEEREALCDGLAAMAGEYEEGWDDGGLSSSGDEDE